MTKEIYIDVKKYRKGVKENHKKTGQKPIECCKKVTNKGNTYGKF